MSKINAMRAMREARYEQAAARAAKPGAAPQASPRRTPRPVEVEPPTAPAEGVTEGLCGHRSMNGRTCTREHGHAAKSHRYS